MTLLTAGKRFRDAVAAEHPLQVVGAINANHALLAKRAGFKAIILLSALFAMSVWTKRFKWAPIMTRKIVYDPPKGHH